MPPAAKGAPRDSNGHPLFSPGNEPPHIKDRMKKYKRLTSKERALVVHLSKGMSLTNAAIAAGYSPKRPDQSGYQAFESVRAKFPELLEKHGLTDDSFIEKYLVPGLEATETIYAQHEGQFTDERELIAWGPRRAYLDMAFKLRGAYAATDGDGESNGPVQVNVVVNVPRPGLSEGLVESRPALPQEAKNGDAG